MLISFYCAEVYYFVPKQFYTFAGLSDSVLSAWQPLE